MNVVRTAGWIGSIAVAVYLALFGAYVYVGDVGAGDALVYLAAVALGLVLRRWWAVAVPVLVLLPLPVLLVVSPPDEGAEYDAAGVAFLVAYWTAIQCVLVAAGVALARVVESIRRQPRPSV